MKRRTALALGAAACFAPRATLAQTASSEDSKKSLQAQAERAGVILDRGKQPHYTRTFDLSGLQRYVPQKHLSGWLRIHGNNYLADGMLGAYWEQGFTRFHPEVKISYYLPTAAVAFAALYYDQADLVMGHKPGFYDLLAYERVFGYDPLEITAVTGSYDVPGWENATVLLVNKDNPLKGITLKQIDGVFGAARDGGWAGTNFRPDRARGPEANIRTWGQLGLTGEWANKPINVYGFNLRYNTATDFADKYLGGGDKWNENLHAFAHIVRPDGTRYIEADQITDALARDKYGIGYNRYRGERPNIRRIPIAANDGAPFVEHRLETVQDRTYLGFNEQYFYTSVAPSAKLNPIVREFIRYALSQEGQGEVQRDGKYLPLTAAVVREQLKKLEAV